MAYSAMNVDTPFDVILHDGSDTFIITALRVLNLGNQFGSELKSKKVQDREK